MKKIKLHLSGTLDSGHHLKECFQFVYVDPELVSSFGKEVTGKMKLPFLYHALKIYTYLYFFLLE